MLHLFIFYSISFKWINKFEIVFHEIIYSNFENHKVK